MTDADRRNTEFVALLEQYCTLGLLLPPGEDIDIHDDAEMANIEMVLAEMNETKIEIDLLLERSR